MTPVRLRWSRLLVLCTLAVLMAPGLASIVASADDARQGIQGTVHVSSGASRVVTDPDDDITLHVRVRGTIHCIQGASAPADADVTTEPFFYDDRDERVWVLYPSTATAPWEPHPEQAGRWGLNHTYDVTVEQRSVPGRDLQANVTWTVHPISRPPGSGACSPSGYAWDGDTDTIPIITRGDGSEDGSSSIGDMEGEFSSSVPAAGDDDGPSGGGALESVLTPPPIIIFLVVLVALALIFARRGHRRSAR